MLSGIIIPLIKHILPQLQKIPNHGQKVGHLNFEIEIQPQILNFCQKFSASGPVAKITLTPELDETLRRIQDSKNVAGIILINKEGITVKSSLDSSVTALVSSSILGVLSTIET